MGSNILITTVKTAMPEVNPASFITAPSNSSWFGRAVQPIKNHPILTTVAVLFVAAVAALYYVISNSKNGSQTDDGDDDLVIRPKKTPKATPKATTQIKTFDANGNPDVNGLFNANGDFNPKPAINQMNAQSAVNIGNMNARANDYKQQMKDTARKEVARLEQNIIDLNNSISTIYNDHTMSLSARKSAIESINKGIEIAERQLKTEKAKLV